MNARVVLVYTVLATGACLPREDSKAYPCTTSVQCATGWDCVDGVCRQGCVGAGDCTTPGWSDTAFTCVGNHCVPLPGVASSSGGGGGSTSSASGATSLGDSSSLADSSSATSFSSSSGSGAGSSSSGGSGGARSGTLVIISGGGGGPKAPGNFHTLQLSVGQPLVGNVSNPSGGSKLGVGILSKRGVP
jgi:hypothetical protein